jgi:hypothetical protein
MNSLLETLNLIGAVVFGALTLLCLGTAGYYYLLLNGYVERMAKMFGRTFTHEATIDDLAGAQFLLLIALLPGATCLAFILPHNEFKIIMIFFWVVLGAGAVRGIISDRLHQKGTLF